MHQIDPSVPEAALLLRYRLNKTITLVSGYYEEQLKLAAGLGQVFFLLWFVLCHMRARFNTSQDCFWVHLKTNSAGTHLELGHLRGANHIGSRRSSCVESWVRQVVLMLLPTTDWQATTSWLMCCCTSLMISLKATTCCKNHLSLWVPGEIPITSPELQAEARGKHPQPRGHRTNLHINSIK